MADIRDGLVNIKEQPIVPVDEDTLRDIVTDLERRLLGKPELHSFEFLSADVHGKPIGVWGDGAAKRSIQGWIMKIAYEHLGQSRTAAYNLMRVLNEEVLEMEDRSIEGIEAEDGPDAVIALLLQIFAGKK